MMFSAYPIMAIVGGAGCWAAYNSFANGVMHPEAQFARDTRGERFRGEEARVAGQKKLDGVHSKHNKLIAEEHLGHGIANPMWASLNKRAAETVHKE